jgi:hypothetical protein
MGELLTGTHNFTPSTGDSFKAALFLSSATINAATTVYSTTGEVSGAGYTAGGIAVPNANPPVPSNTSATAGTAYWTPSGSLVYSSVTLTVAFNCLLIYNTSKSNKAVSVHTFGDQTITAGTFTLTMPVSNTSTALLRLATT